MKIPLTVLLLALGIPAMGQDVQESPDSGEAAKARRSCRIVYPERPNDAPKLAYLFDGKKSQQVSLPSMNFSEVIALPPGDIAVLMTPSEITDHENLPAGAPRLNIPEGVRDFYILVTPDPTNSTFPVKLNMVNASDGKFRQGETLWFNLTGDRIVAKLEGSQLSVPPLGQAVSKAPIQSSGYYRAEFAYQAEGKGAFQRITEQQWWHDAGSRHLGFIAGSGGRLPKIYFYRDFRLSDNQLAAP